jgi:hypothetical protein
VAVSCPDGDHLAALLSYRDARFNRFYQRSSDGVVAQR